MKILTRKLFCIILLLAPLSAYSVEQKRTESVGDLSAVRSIVIDRDLTEQGKKCVSCHVDLSPGIVNDWKNSRHAHVGVSCIDCHQVDKDSPMAVTHETIIGKDKQMIDKYKGMFDKEVLISVLVPPSTCGRCHADEQEEFNNSGHIRAYRQLLPKDSMHALIHQHEGQNNPELSNAPFETGCMQCHGTEIKLDKDGRPTPDTWPLAGIGTLYPDGSIGNCSACHTRHKFSIAESRKPAACSSCHLGPDHPDKEIFENSKHGQIFASEGESWNWETAPDAWEPGDYRAPTCATCHMSGIGELKTTHNVNERLHWNLWAKESKVRNSTDVMSPLLGNGVEGRKLMKQVCSSCHSKLHTDGFFTQGDKGVMLYNEAYWKPAKSMFDELKEKGLLKDNQWSDEFQITFYHLWHHEGRRARQGGLMGGPDYAHWHGFFVLQQDLYKLENIYHKRLKSGKIED